jgi:hypothetical protein
MRSSARNVSGFTLLEVTIAATLLTIILIVALSHVEESTNAVTGTSVQADLRRIGEGALQRLTRDLRSTQARYVTTTASTIQLYVLSGFNPDAGAPLLIGASGSVPPPSGGGDPLVWSWRQSGTTLQVLFATQSTLASATAVDICGELTPVSAGGGFLVSPASGGTAFSDAPVPLRVELALQRKTRLGTVTVRVASDIDLKASSSYR